jgi:hypothetical protein
LQRAGGQREARLRAVRVTTAPWQPISPSQHWIETYKSLITLAVEGFKFAALANGGAAVALLAYLGNVASKGAGAPDMRCSMAAFLAGLAACGLSMLLAYLTQLKLLNESSVGERPKLSHGWLLWCAIALFVCSLLFFGVGSWQAVIRFR